MKKPPSKKATSSPKTVLRKKAEALLKKQTSRVEELTRHDMKQLIHELGTHQIELEIQNEELRRAQEELEASRRKYTDLYEFAPVGYFTLDTKGVIREANMTGAELLGELARKKLVNVPFSQFINREGVEELKRYRDHIAKTLGARGKAVCEMALRKKDGTLFFAQLQSIAVEETAGQPEHILTALIDITDRKRAEEVLRRNEAILKQAEQMAHLGVWEIVVSNSKDLNANPLSWSDEVYRIFGYEPHAVEVSNELFFERVHPDDRRSVRDSVARAMAAKGPYSVEHRVIRPDGTERTVWEHAEITFDAQGRPARVVGAVQDITERKRAGEALRESEDRYRNLFANMINGFAYHKVIFDENGKPVDYEFEAVNSAFERLVGMKAADLLGKRLSQVLPLLVKDPAQWTGDYGRVARTGREMEFELRADVLEKQFLISAYSPSKGWLAAVFEDVTARRLAERSLRESNAELEVVNNELEAFSFTVANDLRAPLRSIEGFTKALAEDYGPHLDDTGHDYCRRINDGARRMNQLVDAMLSMARQTRGELTQNVVNLTAAAQSISEELRAKQPDRQVRFSVERGMKVMGDREMLQLVLENLLDNAWKFTSKHPSANIEVGVTEVDGGKAYFVRDDGAGFDMAYSANLFQPFRRLHDDKEYPGIGIGLAIASHIIRRHGGRIWAESEPEKGAVFYFTL